MNNSILNVLKNFEKPDENFIKNKECLICLESIDIEAQQLVKLPCECNNSVYHISCIMMLINSGQNKNFCPHCKKNYTITPTTVVIAPVLEQEEIIVEDRNRIRLYVTILYIHILSNSLMNIINISESREYPQEIANIVSKMLIIFYFCKLLLNMFIMFKVKTDNESIESYLSLSYAIQTLLLILFICLLSSVKKDYNSIVLLINNLFFYFGDLAFRIAIECKLSNIFQNRVQIIE
jgi:hypothetical protein